MNIHSQSIKNYNISFKGDEFMDYKVAQVSKEEVEAIKKAENEYEKFRIKQDKEYISSMDEMYKRYLEESNK